MIGRNDKAPPPPALGHLHFNDTIQYLIAAEDRTHLWSWLFRWR